MFESAELDVDYTKEQYTAELAGLRLQLFKMQQDLKSSKIPMIIIVDGVPGAGRGEIVNLLNEWMDSRNIINRTFWTETSEETERPEFWRYWMALPGKGEIGVFFSGWYEKPVMKALAGKSKDSGFEQQMNEIVRLERMLTADGMLIVKLWLHLSGDSHKKVMKKRKKTGVNKEHKSFENKSIGKAAYESIRKAYAKAIRLTDTKEAHWYLINSQDNRYRNISVIKTLISNMQNALDKRGNSAAAPVNPVTSPQSMLILDNVDLTLELTKKEYSAELPKYQAELHALTLEAFSRGISTVILFEGWDAAGKGGAIRRITSAIDARMRRTIQVAAPTDEEKSHHYLWRFWRYIPRAGYVTIFDRSWYGRVLVERVEGFACADEWSRAYEEINEFERQLENSGVLLIKFWVHISQEEQLKRFKDREASELKRYKITDEDWRNRDKSPLYNEAINDMFIRTSTDIAPWTIIAGNSKYYSRIEVIKTVCKALKERLKKK